MDDTSTKFLDSYSELENRYTGRSETKAYLVGGGIASLASAAYLIRDCGVPGDNISIFEASSVLGGSLDGEGSPNKGYVIRGGRMLTEEVYTCLFDLLSFIPSLTSPDISVKDEIHDFNDRFSTHARSRLVRNGVKIDASVMGLSVKDRLDLIAVMASTEDFLGVKRIEDIFDAAFFSTNFWCMWRTTFAFQPWHSAVELKRYLIRFIQEFPRLDTLVSVWRTPLNQYDSIVRPLVDWLKSHDVHFVLEAEVTGLDFTHSAAGKSVERLHYVRGGTYVQIALKPIDLVFVTNGSMTASSSLGSMTSPATLGKKDDDSSWKLWEKLAKEQSDFGRPEVFNSNVSESKWLSFTATMHDPTFFSLMEKFTGNEAGTGALVTIMDSNWLMSVVLPHQPHFANQSEDEQVFWGYGLYPDEVGNYVKKKMSDCAGSEILEELIFQMRFDSYAPKILKTSNCIPCMMPFITSQFMPRVKGDRPLVRPTGTTNIAFIGQFCEIPDEVVFTVEYSVRSAQTAVYSLLEVDKEVTPLYKAQHDLGILLNSLKTLFD
jgi:oleate hydratase